jgi:hypothetical protein
MWERLQPRMLNLATAIKTKLKFMSLPNKTKWNLNPSRWFRILNPKLRDSSGFDPNYPVEFDPVDEIIHKPGQKYEDFDSDFS